jgi:eukaryotic-like serine/threonine-protein kinase
MSMTRLLPGDPRFVGQYAVWVRLGPGAIGPLYLGYSQGGTRVTVRVLREQFAADDELRVRLAREVALAAEVRGPFLARLADARLSAPGQAAHGHAGAGQAGTPQRDPGPVPWIAWEYLRGPSLATVMSARAAMPMSQVAAMAAGLGTALRALHDAGVVHGDLHPGNVFVVNGMPRLTGFGTRVVMEAALAGLRPSPAAREFLAPEQASGGPASMAGDMFSLAAVLVRAAGGTGPFGMGGGESSWVNLGGVPPELRPLITRCLDRDPGSRPTAAEFRSVVAAAHPALLSPDVVSGQVPGPITWPEEEPAEDEVAGPAAPVSAPAVPAVPPAPMSAPFASSTAVPVSGAAPAGRSRASRSRTAKFTVAGFMGASLILVLIGMASNHRPSAPSLSLPDYQPGDCLSLSFSLGSSGPWPDPVTAVPCTQRHTFEVIYANYNFWPSGQAYPGQSELDDQGAGVCGGVPPEVSRYTFTYVEPVTSGNWADGDRDLECIAYQPEPGSQDGAMTITHSVKGAGN